MQLSRRAFLAAAGACAAAPMAWADAATSRWSTAPAERPNILFFFPDQHRYDWIGTWPGMGVRTPVLDALGQRGVRFNNAWCASPLCAPSRACLALGVEYDRCGVPSNRENLSTARPNVYRLLRDAGYAVLGCGKFDLNKGEQKWGIDGRYKLDAWGYTDGVNSAGKWDAIRSGAESPADPYMAYLHNEGLAKTHVDDMNQRRGGDNLNYRATFPTPLPEPAYGDNWVAQRGLELIDGVASGTPWFLQVNFPGPHSPLDITARMEAECRGIAHPPPVASTQYNADDHTAIRQNYSAMVENIDRWLGIYLNRLEERGELQRTLVIFSSDHGEMLGDHDLWGKSKPHEPSVGVPLVAAGPGIAPRGGHDALVSHMDLTATFLECAGVPVPETMDSRSLWPLLRGRIDAHRPVLHSGLDGWRAVRDGRYKLVQGYPDPDATQLYDLATDPGELTNLAGSHPGTVERLSQHLPI